MFESSPLGQDPFRVAVEAAPNAMIMINEKGEIVLVNRQVENLFGYSKEELLGQLIEVLVPPRYQARHPKDRSEFWNDPKPRSMGAGRDLYGIRKDGEEVPVEIGLTPVEIEGARFVISSIVDITERKLAEVAIREKSEELARSNAELEQFAYVASHDLQAPLRHITTYVQFLEEELKDQIDPKVQKWIQFIVGGTQRMRLLINGLLAFSRVSRGGNELEKVSIGKVIKDVLLTLQEDLKETEIVVDVSQFPDIMADRHRLVSLFQNLIENALKFKHKDRKPKIEMGCEDQGTHWKFFVRDNGIGIDEKFMDKIFVIFQRLHNADEYPGTGIGLAVCKRIVDSHGGRIWFESQKGEGTAFCFTLSKHLRTTK